MEKKIFKANFTRFFIFSVIPILVAMLLILKGVKYFKHVGADRIGAVSFCIVPIILGIIIILALLILFFGNLGKKLTITPDSFTFSNYNKSFAVSWKNLIFTTPNIHQKTFRQIIVSDGHTFEKIDNLFFPELSFMIEIIRAAKQNSRDKAFEL